MNSVKMGTFTAVAAENVDVVVGFVPTTVILLNPATADYGFYVLGGAQLEVVSDTCASCAGDIIEYGDADGDTGQGFTLIAGAALNDDTETITYIALRGQAG